MDVKEAVRMAKEYLVELFAEESISDVGLEEVKFEDPSNKWNITIGFSRPWDQKYSLANALGGTHPSRSYKVVRINDDTGRVECLTDRVLNGSG